MLATSKLPFRAAIGVLGVAAAFVAAFVTAPLFSHGSAERVIDSPPPGQTPNPIANEPVRGVDSCLARTICSVKERIRWQTPAWTPSQCRKIADAVTTSASRHQLSPTLLLAVMINESDMNEKAVRPTFHGNRVYAKDGGLMAIRCIVDKGDRCTNGLMRGMPWKDLMDPVNNIELGAKMLALYRDGGGVTRTTIRKRDAQGNIATITKDVPCRHKTHAYWAHYNHGPRYIEKGYPRHYAHRVAVLDHALASVMNVPAPELTGNRLTIRDPGMRERTADRPMEPRFKKLCSQIREAGACAPLALR